MVVHNGLQSLDFTVAEMQLKRSSAYDFSSLLLVVDEPGLTVLFDFLTYWFPAVVVQGREDIKRLDSSVWNQVVVQVIGKLFSISSQPLC
jgi:hypothetical protein